MLISFLNCHLWFLQDSATLVKASSTEPCLNGFAFQSNLGYHLNTLRGYHQISVFSESLEAFLDFLKGIHLMIPIFGFPVLLSQTRLSSQHELDLVLAVISYLRPLVALNDYQKEEHSTFTFFSSPKEISGHLHICNRKKKSCYHFTVLRTQSC